MPQTFEKIINTFEVAHKDGDGVVDYLKKRAIEDTIRGESALMLVCARLRYVASKDWGAKRYLNMKHLYELENQREIETELKKARKNLA